VPGQVASLAAYVVLVRFLSESEFGIYSLFYALIAVVSTALSLGLENTLRRYQPEYLRQGEHRLAHLIVRRIGAIRLATNVVVLLLIMALWDTLAPFFKIADYETYFWLFSLIILTRFQCSILTLALSSHLLQQYSAGPAAMFAVIKVLGYVFAAGVLGFDLWTVFWVDLVAYVLYYAAMKYFYEFRPDHRSGTIDTIPKAEKRRMLRYGAYYNFNDAGTLALSPGSHNFFLAALLDPIAVGVYSFCTRLDWMLSNVNPLRHVETVVFPIFFSLDHRKHPERVTKSFSLLLTIGLLVRIPVAVFVICYYREIVTVVFGGKFIEYSYVMAGVMFFSVFNTSETPVGLVAQLEEKVRVILGSKIFGLYGLAANIILIPIIGISGAVIAHGTALLFKTLFIWWFVRDLARWEHAVGFVLRSALVWGVFAGLAYLGGRFLPAQPLAQLAFGLCVWCGFGLLYVRSGVLTDEQRETIGNLFGGREKKVLRLLGVTT
jgi:O-antigen/teichoic acid export membrane protein